MTQYDKIIQGDNMKQIIKLLILILIIPLFLVSGCMEKEYDNIVIEKTSINEKYGKGDFNINDIVINVRNKEDIVKTISATKNNISEDDLEKLNKIGIHEITIFYESLETKVTINIVNTYNVFFYVGNKLVERKKVLSGDDLVDIPNVPSKLEYEGKWDTSDFNNITSDMDVFAIYIKNPDFSIEEVVNNLDETYNNYVVDDNFIVEKYMGDCTITWSTSSGYLLEDGIYDRPYTDEEGIISFVISDGITTVSKDYNVTFKGYRSLNEGIASGYVYSNYPTLTDEFFDTMDIIYCAFVMVDVNGDFVGLDASNTSVYNSNEATLAKIKAYVSPKAKRRGSYVVASLAGGGSVMAETMDIIAASDTLRKNLAKNIVDLINKYDLDGVDVDWETPSYSKRTNFTKLIKEIYTAVKANNPNHLVTSAIGGGGWQPQLYDLENSIEYLDYVNVMSYSMYSNSGYYHSPLYSYSSYYNTTYNVGRSSESVDSSIGHYNDLGVSNEKLIIGAAFYGKRQIKNNGRWSSNGSINYDVIKRYRESGDYYSFYDERAEAPFLLKKDGTIFISFDDDRSIIAKCKYVFEKKLAGIMYWENGCDPTGDLVKAIKEGMKK